ncbi:MAG: ABC-type Fe3+-hydroxamate transport system substrate-binding protein [Sphingobacteriales bacterium]|jgi:ABC-type Fe3+-hydroxamate transport system substrate-binding protein
MFYSGHDMMGRELVLPNKPKRIISLVPSISESLHELGLEEEVIGITKFCVHPESWFRSKTRIGGTKNPNLELIKELNPDLIIANKEENRKEDLLELALFFPIYISDVNTLNDNQTLLNFLAKIGINKREFIPIAQPFPILNKRVLYLIWKGPWMGAAKGTYIDAVLSHCGLDNALDQSKRYPCITEEDWGNLELDYIFYSSEPYPFKAKDTAELKERFPNAKHLLVDGEMFSWFGTRVSETFSYFKQKLIPLLEVH